MNREVLSALVRLLMLAGMAIGARYAASGSVEAACWACDGSNACIQVDSGPTTCTMFSDGTCVVSGGICNS